MEGRDLIRKLRMGANCPDMRTSPQGQKPVLGAWCGRLQNSYFGLLGLFNGCACHLTIEVKVGELIEGQSS
jgi:hypothetical protein